MVLAGIFFAIGLVWLVAFAMVASAAASRLRAPRVRRLIDAITGAVLVGLGARLAVETR